MKNQGSWVAEGLVTGLIGYATVVALFALLNLVQGNGAFHTAAIMGSALFFGSREVGGVVSGPGPIIAYNGLHMMVSLAIGLGAGWLVFQAEKNRPLWYVIFFIFLAGFIFSVSMMGIFAVELFGLISWPLILVANLVAGLTAGGFLWYRHVKLLVDLGREQ